MSGIGDRGSETERLVEVVFFNRMWGGRGYGPDSMIPLGIGFHGGWLDFFGGKFFGGVGGEVVGLWVI